MSEQDPQFGPLHHLDPAEPEEPPLGKLEPLDPESDDPSSDPLVATPSTASRSRNGMGLAVGLAVLLSLSSIAAIGGLVAISASSFAPAPESAVTRPIESAAAAPTIRVEEPAAQPQPTAPAKPAGESAAGPATSLQSTAPTITQPQVPVTPSKPAGAEEQTDGAKGGNGAKGGKGRSLEPARIPGAWCDASPGTSCDAVVVDQPAP